MLRVNLMLGDRELSAADGRTFERIDPLTGLKVVLAPQRAERPLSFEVASTLLGAGVVDQVFRCINGSVAVSAYELSALPLPEPEVMAKLEMFVTTGANAEFIEGFIAKAYGVADATRLAA